MTSSQCREQMTKLPAKTLTRQPPSEAINQSVTEAEDHRNQIQVETHRETIIDIKPMISIL